jgi:glycosyltransferase involved in cell wall biosynthesis
MKILHIITSLELGGAEKLLSELIPLQKELGYDVELMILSDINSVFEKDLIKRGIKVSVSKYNSKVSSLNIFAIAEKIRKENYDIVHVHLVHAQYWTRFAKILDFNRKRKYITTEHSTSNRRRNSIVFKLIDKFVFRGFDKIVSISEATEKSLKEWIGGDEKNYCVIANGVDLSHFENVHPISRDEIGVENSDTVLMMVSRFQAAKNQKGVVSALKSLSEEYKVVFVGDGVLERDVQEFAKKEGVEDRVRFLGLRKDIPQLLKAADIIIQYSFFEGFGITAVEGMASHKPVIASDVPGLAEVVRGAGFLCSNDDYKELAKLILKLKDEKLYKEVSDRCLERSKKFTIENSAKEYLELYKKMLERE